MTTGDITICLILLVGAIFALLSVIKRKKHGGCPCGGDCGCCGGHCRKHGNRGLGTRE